MHWGGIMPHFDFIGKMKLKPEEEFLLRARFHIRSGKRRLRQQKITDGIVTLYDALASAMQWYIASPERRTMLLIEENENLNDDHTLFNVLRRSGVIDDTFNYSEFEHLVEDALGEGERTLGEEMLASFDRVMEQIGIMPFDEDALPPEDPSAF